MCTILLMWLMLFFIVIGKTKIYTHITYCCLQKWKMLSIKNILCRLSKRFVPSLVITACHALVHLIHWALRCEGNFTMAFFKLILWIDFLVSSYWFSPLRHITVIWNVHSYNMLAWLISCAFTLQCPHMNTTGHHWWSANTGPGIGLVPSEQNI